VIIGVKSVHYRQHAERISNWLNGAKERQNVVRLGYYEDETFNECHRHLPATHFLESWGDALTSDGTLVPIQPLIAPLFGGITELELLARIAGSNVTNPYEIVRETFATFKPAGTLKKRGRNSCMTVSCPTSAAKPGGRTT